MPTIFDLRKKYYGRIDQLDFDLILEAILKKSRTFMLAHPEYALNTRQKNKTEAFIRRRLKDEPLAYILGEKEFYGLAFFVNKNTLIPRPETEMIVEEVIKKASEQKNKKITIIDVGTGSGCIIITLAKLLNHEFFGIDISARALATAKKNAKAHNVLEKIKFLKGDLLKSLLKNKLIASNEIIITANLPYLDKNWKKLLKNKNSAGLKYEPAIALDGGRDGLDLYRMLAEQIKQLKTAKAISVYCEIEHPQTSGMKKIFSFAKSVEIKQDNNCLDRIVAIKI